jgi:hypothetical protein
MNYLEDINIDESALDIEWLRQPYLMLEYGMYCADKRKEMDVYKEEIKLVEAKLDKKIRESSERKMTESELNRMIAMQPEYQEAVKRYINAKYEYEIASAAVRALETKKSALENLVKLHGQQYFAGPKVPRNLEKEWENMKGKYVDSRIAKKLNKRN